MKHITPSFYFFLILCLLLLLSACGDGSDECSEQPLSGMIDGIDFNFNFGIADIGASGTNFEFYPGSFDFENTPCFPFGSGVRAFGNIDISGVGKVDFSPTTETFTLFNPDGFLNIIVTDGFIEITSSSANELRGILFAEFDEENNLCGTFSATICN